MEDGALNDVTETSVTLKNDVECILLECHRDRPGIFASGVTEELLSVLAARVAGHLGPIIGGRWVPNRYAIGKMERDQRDAAVRAAFTGDNHAALMRQFKLSRRLVYAILARTR